MLYNRIFSVSVSAHTMLALKKLTHNAMVDYFMIGTLNSFLDILRLLIRFFDNPLNACNYL